MEFTRPKTGLRQGNASLAAPWEPGTPTLPQYGYLERFRMGLVRERLPQHRKFECFRTCGPPACFMVSGPSSERPQTSNAIPDYHGTVAFTRDMISVAMGIPGVFAYSTTRSSMSRENSVPELLLSRIRCQQQKKQPDPSRLALYPPYPSSG